MLGAGFSMAIAPTMPSTETLGERVLSAQRSIHDALVGHRHSAICDGLSCDYPILGADRIAKPTFELWLSTLAEAQPHLLEPENDRRRALFNELTGLIALTIDAAMQDTMARGEPPNWLSRLVTLWNERRTEVITFNYDTLVEATVDWLELVAPCPPDGAMGRLVSMLVGPSVIPSFEALYVGIRPAPADTFWYRKLHGSTHWYWDKATRSAESMVQVGVRYRWNDPHPVYNEFELRDHRAPGKEPVVVPPTTGKSAYFENPIIRFLWNESYKALLAARRVFVIGYSLPEADLLVGSLLGMSVTDSEVWVIDPDPTGRVATRFAQLEPRSLNLEFCGQPVDMEAFVETYSSMTG